MAEHPLAQVGDDALAQRGDEIKARGTRQREHRHNGDHDGEIAVDEADALAREAEIDHAPDRDRHHQGGHRCGQKSEERRERPPAIARDIGHERDERPELAALHRRGGARGRALRMLDRNRARGVSLGDVHLKLPFATSAERGRSRRDNASASVR